MPLKPIFDKAPLTAMNCQPLRAGLVRMDSAAMKKLYAMTANTNAPADLEGTFRLACIVTPKPSEEPVTAKLRALLLSQREDGSFALSFKDSVMLLRAAWALYEYEGRKPLLEHIARWCAFAVQHWDDLMADQDIYVFSADLLELLENLYRVTGKTAVLTLCERVANQTMSWSGVLNTLSSQRPTSKAVTREELSGGLAREQGSQEGYYTQFYRANHAESLADGARSAMARGWYSGSATELNATRIGWERLSRHHGAICGGLTSDEMLEGTSPSAAVSTVALGAWAEALCTAAMGDHAMWAFEALERMAFNAMPATLVGDKLLAFQRVNTLVADPDTADCLNVTPDHAARALNRLVRGYAALASSAVTAWADGAGVNLYMPGRYAIPMGDELLMLTVGANATGASITIHCKQPTEATIRLRMPAWSRNTDVAVNGADIQGEVMHSVMAFNRTWHDGDVIELTFEQTLTVADGHHQGRYVLRGPVLMALPVKGNPWQRALVSAEADEHRVIANMCAVKAWKAKSDVPADVPVLPDTADEPQVFALTPYARTAERIALFPGRKKA
ncbi:MAG: glycoside hydrolase family 127 protein [Clostridiales bacterium]|nr:glycoside hydrolase family 127 protein [Clostridiales bacterium]